MKITPLQQYMIFGAVLMGAILFGYYQYLWKPVNVQIVKLESTRDQKKKDLEEAKRIVAKYAEFKKQASTVKRELDWFETRVPKILGTPKLVEALNILQQRSGVKFNSMTFQASKAKEDYVEIPTEIRFSSDFSGLLTFLYQMSNSDIFLIADGLTVTYATSTVTTDNLNVQMFVRGVASK